MTARCVLYTGMGALQIFASPWVGPQVPRLLLPKFLMGFNCSDRSCECAYKIFRSFTHSWDNGGTQKILAVLGYAHAPFSPTFSWVFVRMDPVNVSAKFAVRSFARSWDNSDCSFRLGLQTPNLEEGEAVGGRGLGWLTRAKSHLSAFRSAVSLCQWMYYEF